MRSLIPLTLITITLLTSASGFSLIGEWTLSTEHLDYAKTLNQTNITFSFFQQVNPQNTISRSIIVSACRTLIYTFTYRENSIVPIFVRFGNNNRQCRNQEVNEIRRKMESVFYFSILNNRLILIFPSRQVAFTLFKDTSVPTSIKGNWNVVQVNGNKVDTDKMQVQQNRILLCGGKIVLEYKLQAGNKIILKQVSNSGDCPNQDLLLKSLKDSQYYSLNNIHLQLYNTNLQPTVKALYSNPEPSLSPFSKQTLHDKWYIHSINGTKLDQQTQPIYYYYFLIITAERFRFYGGCNVKFSFYDFVNGFEVRHRDVHYVKKPSCRYVNEDTLVLNSLFDRGNYLSFDQKTGIISFFDAEKKNLMDFTAIMSQTRDILPTANY